MLLSPDPAVQSSLSGKLRQDMTEVCKVLFSITTDASTPTHIVASLLQLLAYVNSEVSFIITFREKLKF